MRRASPLVTVLLVGCAAHQSGAAAADPYGFFSGLLHGLLFPWAVVGNVISWLASLVDVSIFSSVQIVGRPNTGFFYYLGFLFGVCVYGGSSAR